jgi:hypothetical protein
MDLPGGEVTTFTYCVFYSTTMVSFCQGFDNIAFETFPVAPAGWLLQNYSVCGQRGRILPVPYPAVKGI